MQNHDSSTKMLPNFIELFYVTIIAFLDVQKSTQEDYIKQSKSHLSNHRFYSRKISHKNWIYFWNLQVQVNILT